MSVTRLAPCTLGGIYTGAGFGYSGYMVYPALFWIHMDTHLGYTGAPGGSFHRGCHCERIPGVGISLGDASIGHLRSSDGDCAGGSGGMA